MSTFSSPAGWRERTKQTRAKHSEYDDKAAIRAERARLDSENAARAMTESAALEAANKAALLACPCCRGEGKVTAEVAELVYRALERLPSDSRPDPAILANLAKIARHETTHTPGPKLTHGLAYPAPVSPVEHAATAPATTRKPNRINRFTEDGALIELDG